MMLVDAHCHLDHPDFSDIDAVIKRARAAGVRHIIANSTDLESMHAVLELAANYDIVHAALGLYPRDALENEAQQMSEPIPLKDFNSEDAIAFIGQHKDIIAIGEVGLDYKNGGRHDEQKQLFRQMIALAEQLDKPIIVHSRKAELDCIELLESSRLKVVMHCFSGRFSLVKRIIDNGWYLTVPTHVVRAEQVQKIVKEVDISRLLTETDAPYLSPFPGKRNEPAFVAESVRKIAEIKGMDPEEVANNIFMNFQRVFL